MKRKFEILIALLALVIIGAKAQKPVITFVEKEYDFGSINETDGKVTHVFEFTNTGAVPLVIQRVQASCGCTTPDWTKQPVEPGKKGTVTAIYNPLGRPGVFSKGITVYSNASNETEQLSIKGNVISKQQEESNAFPYQAGGLQYSSKAVTMGNVNKGSSQIRTLKVKNVSNENIKITVDDIPAYVNVAISPNELKPGESGTIDFALNSAKTNIWGAINHNACLVINGNKVFANEYKIGITGNITEDLTKLSIEQKRNAPIFEVKSPNVYFGQITKGQKVRGKIVIKNSGINNLEIRNIQNDNSGIAITTQNQTIKSGKNSDMKIDVDTKTLAKGDYKKAFIVQTNDPQNQFVTFNLTWNVK
ncbi:MAG: DUF1573 domain-containing protein [Paludibacteraceae bacterium]